MLLDLDWISLTKESRRFFSNSTWVPLRAAKRVEEGRNAQSLGYVSEFFGCGSVAIPPKHRELGDKLGWSDIGLMHNIGPYAYEDGHYSPTDEYQYNDKNPVGVELVLEHPQPVVGGRLWLLNPDLVIALRLVKEGNLWVRPEEDFAIVAREFLRPDGQTYLIEIKRTYLADYLAARGMSLRLSYYFQRVLNLTDEQLATLGEVRGVDGQRDQGRFSLSIRSLDKVFGGTWAVFKAWRTDVDDDDDAPVMGPENSDNVASESSQGERMGLVGTRIEGEFWRDEWVDNDGRSVRVRGDSELHLPTFIVDTGGARQPSQELDNEDIGRWLWFKPEVVNDLLRRRGFSLKWYTAETAGLKSTSGYSTHIGLNSSDFVTAYASDIARLAPWEQQVWASHNTGPDGKVSKELLDAQVRSSPASTLAPEEKIFQAINALDRWFKGEHGTSLFTHELPSEGLDSRISRFASYDQPTLLRLAKELVRIFTDRLDKDVLKRLSTRDDKASLGSIKLLEGILADKIGAEKARLIFGPIVGAYDMRIGDAHPTGSKIAEAIELAEIKQDRSFLRQGEQLIHNYGRSIYWIGVFLSGADTKKT